MWVRRPLGDTVIARLEATSCTFSFHERILSSGSSSILIPKSYEMSAALVVMVGVRGGLVGLLINTVVRLD